MDTLLRRLKYYGIGFGLGLVFVFFFFQNRGCSWTPSNRVKNAILDRVLVASKETMSKLEKKGITKEELVLVLNDGDVDFDRSEKHKNPKVYAIEKDGLSYLFTLPEESFIAEVQLGRNPKKISNSTTGNGVLVRFPMDKDLVYVDSASVLNCQQLQLGLVSNREILSKIKQSGMFHFEDSKLKLKPKPEHTLSFNHRGKSVRVKAIWYKNKININAFQFEGDTCLINPSN